MFLLPVAWLVLLAALAARPAATLADSWGLYIREPGSRPYSWTSNRVGIPIHGHSGPTTIDLALGLQRWPGRPPPQVTLATDSTALATFTLPDQVRRYHLLLPPQTSTLLLHFPVDLPPNNDHRWLGVQLYELNATARGLPVRAVGEALALLLPIVTLAFAAAWSIRRSEGTLVAITALAALLRIIMVHASPPGFSQDEAVSLVDAWNLARTGRDHLGNPLPLGAQEALGDWISPLLTYLELPFVALFGPSPVLARLVTGLFGALAAPFSYRLAQSLKLPEPAAICAGVVAAISPWQIFLSRFALPPALVPASLTLCLWAALLLLQRGGRADALRLALVAGIALYAYPTMKLAVPLLVAWAVLLALVRHGWRAGRSWLLPALALALLWLPFAAVTLFNPASSTRLYQTALRAEAPGAWLAAWWAGYRAYLNPALYFGSGDGDPVHGLLGRGLQLPVEAPLLAIGLGALVWNCIRPTLARTENREQRTTQRVPDKEQISQNHPEGTRPRAENQSWMIGFRRVRQSKIQNPKSKIDWLFVAGALVLAPLPASLTTPSPHAFRAGTIAPLYVLIVALGTAAVWRVVGRVPRMAWRRAARGASCAALGLALAWQAGGWFDDYIQDYPAAVAQNNQDGALETMARVIAYADRFDEVWIDTDGIIAPAIYLLAARPMPPAESQAQIVVLRRSRHLNQVVRIGRYRFGGLAALPEKLPTLEVIPGPVGKGTFVLQEWHQEGRRILIVRRR